MYEILFQYGPISLRTFNLFLALGFILGMYFLLRYISRNKLNLSFLSNHFLYFIILPLIGGRIFYIFEHLNLFQANPLRAFAIWDLNFSAFGILYTAVATLYYFAHTDKEDFWAWLDGFSLAGILALVMVHIGHFFNGTNYGIPTGVNWWGFKFDTYNIIFTEPIHPTQLYSALIAFIIYSVMMKSSRRIHLSGIVGTLTIMLYSLAAFGIDFIHANSSTYSKLNYLIIASVGFIFYIHSSHKTHALPRS